MKKLERLIGPKISFEELHQRILQQHPLPEKAAPWEIRQALDESSRGLDGELEAVFRDIQRKNGPRIDAIFQVVQAGDRNLLLDGMVLDEEGRMALDDQGKLLFEPWSSLRDYAKAEKLPPTIEEIRQRMIGRGRWLFPVTPRRDSFLFWLRSNEAQVSNLLTAAGIDQDLEPRDYQIEEYSLASMMEEDPIRMVSVKRGLVGVGKFAQAGLVLGGLGFWENDNLSDGKGYIGRVRFEGSNLIEYTVISPLKEREVVLKGGLPMNIKHGVPVVRMEGSFARKDLVAAAFIAFGKYSDLPLVLRFNILRPWLGEHPKHGQSS